MKRSAGRAIALLIVVVYIVWHPQPTRRELTVEALWAVAPESATVRSVPEGEPLVAVDVGSVFAYLTRSGDLAYRGRRAFGVALSAGAFVNHSRSAEQLIVQSTSGGFLASLPVAGYPRFVGERLFVVSDAGGQLSEWTVDGVELWRTALASPTLSFAATTDLTAVGPASGGPLLLNGEGRSVELEHLATGEEPPVYAVALSGSPARYAVISGSRSVDVLSPPTDRSVPATLTLYELGPDRGVPVLRRRVARDAANEPLVRLTEDGTRLLYTDTTESLSLVAFDIGSGNEFVIPLQHPPFEVLELSESGLLAALTVSSDLDPARAFARPSELVFFTAAGVVPIRTVWASSSATGIQRSESMVVVRVDGRVLAFDLRVR